MSTPSFPCVAGGLSVEDKEGSHQAPHGRVPCMGEEGKPCHGCVKTSTFFHKERKIMPPRPLAAFKDSDSQCPDLPTLLFSSNPDDERDGRIPAPLEPGRLSTSNLLWNLRVCVLLRVNIIGLLIGDSLNVHLFTLVCEASEVFICWLGTITDIFAVYCCLCPLPITCSMIGLKKYKVKLWETPVHPDLS